MTVESIAEYYHATTKYDPQTLGHRHHQLDWARQPVPFKDYPNADKIDLGKFLPAEPSQLGDRALAALCDPHPENRALCSLSHLLYFANGLTAIERYPDRDLYLRAAPSAGGLYPTEIYVLTQSGADLNPGIYNYQLRTHSLACVWKGKIWPRLHKACFENPLLDKIDTAIVLTGIFYRSAWRYEDRAYRRILLDTGHIIGNLTLYAPCCGFGAWPIGGYCDDELNDALFLEKGEEEAIAVLALVDRGKGIATTALKGPTALASPAPPSRARAPEGERLLALHDAAKIPVGSPIPPPTPTSNPSRTRLQFTAPEGLSGPPFSWADRLSETILKRRSTRAYTSEPISRAQLAMILEAAVTTDETSFDRGLVQTFVAIHRVEGLDPGCYHYDTEARQLRQIRFKDLKEEVQFLCLNQDLGGDAAAVVFHTADLPGAVTRWGDRAYRYLHLDAGQIGQRLNLAAVHLGLGASGIGGFFDDQVNELLGIPDTDAVVYITTIGVPVRREPKVKELP